MNQQLCPGTSSHKLTAECAHLFSTASSFWIFVSHGGSVYIMEIGVWYKSGSFS